MKTNRIFGIFILASLVGCTAPNNQTTTTSSYMSAEFRQVNAALKLCTNQNNYDPSKSDSMPPYSVTNNELKARECFYSAIMRIMVPASKNPTLYTNLIAQDRTLTRQVMNRQITRKQRGAQIQEMITNIRKVESETGAVSEDAKALRNQELGRQAVNFMFSML